MTGVRWRCGFPGCVVTGVAFDVASAEAALLAHRLTHEDTAQWSP